MAVAQPTLTEKWEEEFREFSAASQEQTETDFWDNLQKQWEGVKEWVSQLAQGFSVSFYSSDRIFKLKLRATSEYMNLYNSKKC